jgi:hypothetical protein
MMKPLHWRIKFLALAFIPAVAACGGPSVEDAEAGLCDDLNEFAVALQNLGQMNAQSTVREFESARQDIVDAYQSVQASAETVETARLDELDAAYANLDSTVNAISGRDTLGEAAVEINAQAENVAAARQQLYANLTCP